MQEHQRIAVFYCYNSDWGLTPEELGNRVAYTQDIARQLTEWRRLYYLHRDDVVIDEPHVDVLVDPDSTDHPNYAGLAIMEYRQAHPDVDWTHYHLIGGSPRAGANYAGFGKRGASVGFVLKNNIGTHGHEANGHGLDIGHMGSVNRNGSVNDYGGFGVGTHAGTDLPHNNPYRYHRQIPAGHVVEARPGEGAATILHPLENHPSGCRDQLLRLYDGEGNQYFIAYRQFHGKARIGSPSALICEARYQRQIEPGKTKTIALDPLSVGQERRIGDHDVKLAQLDKGLAYVQVKPVGAGAYPQLPTQAWRFKRPTIDLDLGYGHTGLWYNPKLKGQGFDVMIRRTQVEGELVDLCTVGWYTYSEKDGGPRWYVMQGRLRHGAAELDVYRSDGYRPEHVGVAQLSVLPGDKLLLDWVVGHTGRMNLALDRLYPQNIKNVDQGQLVNGAWHDPAVVVQGLRIHNFGPQLVAYYYGYGPVDPPPPYSGPDPYSAHRWWCYLMDRVGPNRYEGQCLSFRGGAFMHPQAPKKTLEGPASIWLDGGRLILEDPNGRRELQRLM